MDFDSDIVSIMVAINNNSTIILSFVIPTGHRIQDNPRRIFEQLASLSGHNQLIEIICIGDRPDLQLFQVFKDKYYVIDHLDPGCKRNFGINQALGKYITFIDADDLIIPAAVAGLVKILELESPSLVISNFESIHETRVVSKSKNPSLINCTRKWECLELWKKLQWKDFDLSISPSRLPPYRITISRSTIKNAELIFPCSSLGEDQVFAQRALASANSIFFNSDIWYLHQPHSQGLSQTKNFLAINDLIKSLSLLNVEVKYVNNPTLRKYLSKSSKLNEIRILTGCLDFNLLLKVELSFYKKMRIFSTMSKNICIGLGFKFIAIASNFVHRILNSF